MYSVTDSASLGLRERKSLATASGLTAVSRRLTIARGLSGFTIDEVCAEVGISRRTFFNYFPTKEDAIIGGDSEGDAARVLDEFMSRPSGGWPSVIDDLIELIASHFDSVGADATEHAEFIATLEAEPRLLARFVGVSREREKALTALIAQREQVAADDPHAVATVSILSTIIRTASEAFIAPDNADDFSVILTTTLAAFRAVLATPRAGKA
jgi:AcrR family transcriptional regulator